VLPTVGENMFQLFIYLLSIHFGDSITGFKKCCYGVAHNVLMGKEDRVFFNKSIQLCQPNALLDVHLLDSIFVCDFAVHGWIAENL
jgi:hypothetical protein